MEHLDKLVFFDLETGGLNPRKHPILEIAAIAVHAGTYQEIETFEAKVQFDVNQADPDALGVCKFKPSTWEKYALPKSVVQKKFAQFLRRHATIKRTSQAGNEYQVSQLVAHNAPFDAEFIRAFYGKHFLPASPRVLCSLQLVAWWFSQNPSIEPPENMKLGTLSKYFELDADPDHSALNDIRATVELVSTVRRLELESLVATAA